MNLTALLATSAIAGLNFITASPTKTGLMADPGWPLLKRGVHLIWDPADAYKGSRHKKIFWQGVCSHALMEIGCGAGKIYKGDAKLFRNGKGTSYLRVEGAPSMGMAYEKKLRVFRDGTSEDVTKDGWSQRDWKAIRIAKWKKTERPEGQNTVLSWAPDEAWKNKSHRKVYWERLCRSVLAREGCGVGIIHTDGKKTSHVHVEGAPSKGMEFKKKWRVFRDGRSEDLTVSGWPRHKKKGNRKKYTGGPVSQEALLSWDPVDAYEDQHKRRSFWEERCHKALAREGCGVGLIHKGEARLIRNGARTHYVNVEGARSTGMKYEKKMRVFMDGSSEDVTADGWSKRDRKLMTTARRRRSSAQKRHRVQIIPVGSMEASTGTQVSTQAPPTRSDRGPSLLEQEIRTSAPKRLKTHHDQTQPMGSMGATSSSPQLSRLTPPQVPTEETHPTSSQAAGVRQLDLNFPPGSEWEETSEP